MLSPTDVARQRLDVDQPELLVEIFVGDSVRSLLSSHFVLATQPLTEPSHRMTITFR